MHEDQTLVEIGSKAIIDLTLVRDRIPKRLLLVLLDNPVGTVIDYKMTDGNGTGLVLKLGDGSISWFFSEELKTLKGEIVKDKEYELVSLSRSKIHRTGRTNLKVKKYEEQIVLGQEIITMLNPLNFVKWTLYSLKDVF